MSKIKTFAEWVLALTKGYTKVTGKKPDKLSQLKINMEAGQKVRDQEKVIKVDFGKKKPWHEKKAGGGIAGMLGERTGYNGGGPIPTREQMLKILKEDLKREFAKQRDPFPKPGDKEFKDLELKLQQIFAKDRLKSASGGLAGMLGEPTYADENHRVPYGGGGAGKPPITFTLQGGGSYGSNEIGPGLDLTQSGYGFDLGTNIDLPFGFSFTGGVGIGRGKGEVDYNDQNVFTGVDETKLGDKWNVGLKWKKQFNEGGRVPLNEGLLVPREKPSGEEANKILWDKKLNLLKELKGGVGRRVWLNMINEHLNDGLKQGVISKKQFNSAIMPLFGEAGETQTSALEKDDTLSMDERMDIYGKDREDYPAYLLAGGGRVPFRGGKRVWELLNFIRSRFGKDAITTADKIKRPLKVIEKEKTKKMFDDFNNKIATQEALAKGTKKMAGPIENINRKSIFEPTSSDATTWLQQEKFFNPKALDMYGKKVPANWIEVEKKAAQKLIDDLGPLDVSPNHPNYKDMKAIRQSAKDRLSSIKVTEALGGNITMHDWLRMNRKNINIDDYVIKPGAKKVVDELSGIKLAHIQKKLSPADELKAEFPGITDDLIKNILADKNPQRIAEVKAAMKEALKMQEKGMGVEEIINIFKKKPTKHASGGLAGMLGE